MNNNIMSVIFASDNETKLNELTIHRTTASLPFCGRYRFIDFTLSNLVNSGITTVGILTKNNYSSLMDHIRMGRDWDLNRKNNGIAVFPPYVSNTARSIYKGKIEGLYGIIDYLDTAKEEYIIITNSNIAANIDYDDVYDMHIKNGADITMLTYTAKTNTTRKVVVSSKTRGRVDELLISDTPSDKECEIGANIYLFKKDLLRKLVEDAYTRGSIDFEQNIIQANASTLKIYAYPLTGYVAIIDDIKSYYNESMKLLDTKERDDLFFKNGKIFTKVKDSVPTVYRDKAEVKNSLIADGCDINGKVENSILFRGVIVEEGASIKDSIVMENGKVLKNACLSYVISDKNVTVKEDRQISGYATYPVVIVKNKEV